MPEEILPVHPTPPRRFNLGDAMLLIPALAVSTVLLQSGDLFASFPRTVYMISVEVVQLVQDLRDRGHPQHMSVVPPRETRCRKRPRS